MRSQKILGVLVLILLVILVLGVWWWQRPTKPVRQAPVKPAIVQGVSETDAVAHVRARPEVQAWLRLFSGKNQTSPTTGGKPIIAVDGSDDATYSVHVYEQLADHTATFGWYEVDRVTGVVKTATP